MSNFTSIKISKREVSEKSTFNIASEAVCALLGSGLTFSSAESCTGGLIGGAITAVSGSSSVYMGGIITYTNDIKINVLGVEEELIEKYTEVSEAVARSMAHNVKEKLCSDIGVSATGYAGPTGGNANDPVGTVYIGIAADNSSNVYRLSFFDGASRDEIRRLCVEFVLQKLIALCP